MKRIVKIMAIVTAALAISMPDVDARNSNNGRGNGHNSTTSQPGRRPSGNNGIGNRPGNNGNNGNHNANRPGNNGNHNGNNGNNWGYKPVQPGHNPGHNPGHVTPPPPSHNPHNYWPNYHRPTPPPGYAFHGHGPSFGSILGMVLGTAFNASLSYLNSNGYHVASYGDNTIYLSNVAQMNLMWPNATLYYNNGLLSSSRYLYSSQWDDTSRYNRLYNSFCNQYGMPASVNNMGGLMSASWFGYDGRFVSIQYSRGYDARGLGCYYTTLTFGN